MDNAVALVQAYLRVNGYFTVAEYPVLEAAPKDGGYRTVTDLDVLALRLPHAGRLVARSGHGSVDDRVETLLDPALGASPDRGDMIVGEVKEGQGALNEAATEPAVLRTALVRFGCCPAEAVDLLVTDLMRKGRARLPVGHEIRMVVFGSTVNAVAARYHAVALGHVVRFLQSYLREHWTVLRHTDHKDPAFGFLMTLEKALRGSKPNDEVHGDPR
jgi:hypothetical protein